MKESVIKVLYDSLWELEKASVNVRKALIEFKNGKEVDQ